MFKSLILSTSIVAALLFSTGKAMDSYEVHFEDLFNFDPNVLPAITDYTLPITKTPASFGRNVYTVSMILGSTPGTRANFVLATNTEWTMITSVNCTSEFGCVKGVFDSRNSATDQQNEGQNLLQEVDVGVDFLLSGINCTDVLYFSNGVTMVEQFFPFFLVTAV